MSERRRRRAAEGWPIAARLRKPVYFFWAMLLLVGAASVGSLGLLSAEVDRLALVQVPAVEANDQVLMAMTDAQTGLTRYEISGDRGMLEPYFGAHDLTMASLATVKEKFELLLLDVDDAEQEAELMSSYEANQRISAVRWWALAIGTEQALTRGEHPETFRGRALFDRFRGANAEIGEHLRNGRAQSLQKARMISTLGEVASISATLAALVTGMVVAHKVGRRMSRPMNELRATMIRHREGEQSARAREDQGFFELRSVANDFNALTEQYFDLQQIQAHGVMMHELTMEIEHSIRVAPDTQQALSLLCTLLGEGLCVDRVMANTIDAHYKVLVGDQWHLPDLPQLADMSDDLLPHVGRKAEELWLSTGVRAWDDCLVADVQSQERGRMFHRETGARAAIMVPIAFGDRVIGMIYVLMVHEPRTWTESEANVVQQVAGFVARVIVEAEYRAHLSEHVERLELLDRQKGDFLATVSHELRTPLTSISGYLEMLKDGDAGELTAEQEKMLEVVDRNTSRLTSLIEDLLVLNGIETGSTGTRFVGLSMRELIIHAGLELSPFARKSAVDLEIDAGPETLVVEGHRGSLDRAIVNIVSNAIKFSRPGGLVTIRCMLDRSGHRVLFSCQDRGIGIPADDQLQMFTRFYRAKNATDQAIPGTGLGLSIVKQIVDEHGGVLRLTSMEGEGTTVVMELPLVTLTSRPGADGNDSQPEDVFRIRA